jgi:hypothetical protein
VDGRVIGICHLMLCCPVGGSRASSRLSMVPGAEPCRTFLNLFSLSKVLIFKLAHRGTSLTA